MIEVQDPWHLLNGFKGIQASASELLILTGLQVNVTDGDYAMTKTPGVTVDYASWHPWFRAERFSLRYDARYSLSVLPKPPFPPPPSPRPPIPPSLLNP